MLEMSPILITVYNRFDALVKCIENLKLNPEAQDSILYISSDFNFRAEDAEKITQIRKYVLDIKGFKEVRPIFYDTNQGAYAATQAAIKHLQSDSFPAKEI